MGDSMLYDDEMLNALDEYENSMGDNKVSTFLDDCKKINAVISELSDKLNSDSIENLKLDSKFKEVVNLITVLSTNYDELTLSDSEKEKVNEVIDTVKENFVELLNKHINRYNTKVDYINARISDLTSKLNHVELSVEINEIIINLDRVSRCDTINNGDWRQLGYLDGLDYSKLEEQMKNISLVEKKLRMKPMESVEIWASCNHVKLMIDDLNSQIYDDLTIVEINLLLRQCRICYEQIVDMDVRHQLSINELSDKKIVSSYNSKITIYAKEIQKIENLLLEKKKNMRKPSIYKSFVDELDMLELKYDVFIKKIAEYQGKSNDRVIKRLNTSYLKKYEKMFLEIAESILSQKSSLDMVQYHNLTKRLKRIRRKQDSINFDLNISPIMLNGVDVGLDFENKMKDFDLKLDELNEKIQNLGQDKLKIIKDHSVRKDADIIINARWKDIYDYDKLLSSYKKQSPEVYKTLKGKLDERKNRFDKICKDYRGKCPLGVKQVKSAKHLYKKHRKEALVIAGLATMVLLTGHSVIIPAIMHGNIMIWSAAPAMRGLIGTVNNVLGGIIGAKMNVHGIWSLANGVVINSSIASTSLLKGVAYSGLGSATLLSPAIAGVVFGIKNLVGKINSGELKKKLQESEDERKQKRKVRVESKNNKAAEKSVRNEIKDLFRMYRVSGMSLEDFAEENKLSEKQKILLEYLEEETREIKNTRKGGR